MRNRDCGEVSGILPILDSSFICHHFPIFIVIFHQVTFLNPKSSCKQCWKRMKIAIAMPNGMHEHYHYFLDYIDRSIVENAFDGKLQLVKIMMRKWKIHELCSWLLAVEFMTSPPMCVHSTQSKIWIDHIELCMLSNFLKFVYGNYPYPWPNHPIEKSTRTLFDIATEQTSSSMHTHTHTLMQALKSISACMFLYWKSLHFRIQNICRTLTELHRTKFKLKNRLFETAIWEISQTQLMILNAARCNVSEGELMWLSNAGYRWICGINCLRYSMSTTWLLLVLLSNVLKFESIFHAIALNFIGAHTPNAMGVSNNL